LKFRVKKFRSNQKSPNRALRGYPSKNEEWGGTEKKKTKKKKNKKGPPFCV